MLALLTIMTLGILIFFFCQACVVYKVPKSKIYKGLLFTFFLFIQVLPVSFFYVYQGDQVVKSTFHAEAYDKCMNRFNKPSMCEDFASSDTEREFDGPNFALLFIFMLFVLTPTSGASMMFTRAILQKETQPNRKLSLAKKLWRTIAVIAFLTFGFMIVWGFCLPATHVPNHIKTINLIVGLPMLMIIAVLTEAFGKAFAHSGVHSPQNAAVELMDLQEK